MAKSRPRRRTPSRVLRSGLADRSLVIFDVRVATANAGTGGKCQRVSGIREASAYDALIDFWKCHQDAESIGFYHADVDQAAQILYGNVAASLENRRHACGNQPAVKIGDPDDGISKSLCATPRSPLTMHRSAMVGNAIRFMLHHMSKSSSKHDCMAYLKGSSV